MLGELLDRRAILGVGGHHFLEEVAELGGEVTSGSLAAVRLPEDVVLFVDEALEIGVILLAVLEWWHSRVHDEEDDSCCEDIDLAAVVLLGGNFGSHVTLGTQPSS